MEQVKVKKDKLLETLKENREKHKAEYEDAIVKHRAEAISALEDRLARIAATGKVDLTFQLPTPQQFLDSFDEAIAMLEWEQEDEIVLDQQDFQRFVLNKWEWLRQFAASTSLYNARP